MWSRRSHRTNIWQRGEEDGHQGMEKASGYPQGSVDNGVTRIYVCPLILFIHNSAWIFYAARPNSSTSFFSIPSVIHDKKLLTKSQSQLDADQKIKKGLIDYLAIVRLKELRCRQQNTTSSSYHCCSREACQTSWNLIDAGKPALLASPCSDVPVHLLPFASQNSAEGWNRPGVWVR